VHRKQRFSDQNQLDKPTFSFWAGTTICEVGRPGSQMNWQIDIELLGLIVVANGMPIIGRMLLPCWLSSPVDSHLSWQDGTQVFGSSKTRRGFVLGTCSATVAAVLLGLSWTIGFAIGFTSMCGDLFSSFLKRRLGMAPSSRATFLDQIPESLFPSLLCRWMLQLTWADVAFLTLSFTAIDMILSKPLHWFRLRRKPY
jgi:hypothetical protein